MHLYGTTRETLGWIALNARKHAALNPLAIYTDPLTMDDYLSARMISTPFGLYDCDVPCDGSIAIVVSARDVARDLRRLLRARVVAGQIAGELRAAQVHQGFVVQRIELQVDFEPRRVSGQPGDEIRLLCDPQAIGVDHHVADRAALHRVEHFPELRVDRGFAAGPAGRGLRRQLRGTGLRRALGHAQHDGGPPVPRWRLRSPAHGCVS